MRVLLTDGSGLTARQCATLLTAAGHTVEVLSPDPMCLCRFTRHVRRVHSVPALGADPFAWLDAALHVYERGRFDVLLPTQEQVTVLAASPERLEAAGVATVLPAFGALAAVQDKLAAFATLRQLGVPQPPATMITSAAELAGWQEFPVFLKTPVGTASTGVRRVDSSADITALPATWAAAADATGLLAQRPATGPLVMLQSVFDHGRLVAFDATERLREGVRGGASHKQSLEAPAARDHLTRLGAALGWHGALSADIIAGLDGPVFIDVNPRLVEPVNASRAGVDLVGSLLDLARGHPATVQPPPLPGVRTHQILLAILGAAARRARRRDIAAELAAACARHGAYRTSREELTPRSRTDPAGLALLATTTLAVLIRPSAWTRFSGGSVTAYALTPEAWTMIQTNASRSAPG